MNITRTCRIELNADEVSKALTDYVHEKNRYKFGAKDIKSYEECLAWVVVDNGNRILLDWGEAPEAEEPQAAPPSVPCALVNHQEATVVTSET